MKHHVHVCRIGALRLHRAMPCALLAMAFAAPMSSATAMAGDGRFDAPVLALAQAETSSAQAAGAAELKALTEQVLRNLGASAAPGRQSPRDGTPAQPASPGDYQALMNALSTLVEKATRQGRSSEDIYALVQEALANQDDEMLDALIARAGGKVELDRLLRALVQKAALKAADDPYTRMLQAEGEATRVRETAAAETAPPPAAGQGGRTVVVQPGDTLGTIALRVYGTAGRWRAIYEANRDRLKNPDLVPAGMRLRLP